MFKGYLKTRPNHLYLVSKFIDADGNVVEHYSDFNFSNGMIPSNEANHWYYKPNYGRI